MTAEEYFGRLNTDYLAVAEPKEDLYWSNYMGTSDKMDELTEAETRYNHFISNPDRIAELREHIAAAEKLDESHQKDDLLHGLQGWLSFFCVNAIESSRAREMEDQLVQDDSDMFERRKALTLHYKNDQGNSIEASTLVLSTNLLSCDDESVRKSSHDALLELERFVAGNGFIEMVKRRNAFARAQGYDNYFDYKVHKEERMSSEQLFAILDEFEEKTRGAQQRGFESLVARDGAHALKPQNLKYYSSGDSTQALDPYLPFSKSLQRWAESFGRMGVKFRDASLTLDLLDRKGKYENGFMHAPRVAWNRDGSWSPAQINFTSNANPAQVGSGSDGINTLFHEGGHAAHFSNITQNAPCFSQEFPPTAMSYAETQSMFFDSMLGDADWLKRYAKDRSGTEVPDDIIHKQIDSTQPFAAYLERGILIVPYYERSIYCADEEELSAEFLIAQARHWEKTILGLECAPRPTLAIPHLLDQAAACTYHGYLLANMAVYQTRAWFLREFGYLSDNPHIGELLSQHYWEPGNSVSHSDTLISLTGEGFSGQYLADYCNRSVEQAWQEAQASMAAAKAREVPPAQSLNATIRAVHGAEIIATNAASDQNMYTCFEQWVESRYAADSVAKGKAPGE